MVSLKVLRSMIAATVTLGVQRSAMRDVSGRCAQAYPDWRFGPA